MITLGGPNDRMWHDARFATIGLECRSPHQVPAAPSTGLRWYLLFVTVRVVRAWPNTGPSPWLGERARLEGGSRTSSLVAVTDCRVASVPVFGHARTTRTVTNRRY